MGAGLSVVRAWDAPAPHGAGAGRDGVLIGGGRAPRTFVHLRRLPAAGGEAAPVPHGAATVVDEHLVAGPDETGRPWLACADVVVRRFGDPESCSVGLPGCLVMAVNAGRRGCLVSVGGWRARLVPVEGGTPSDGDVSSYASALHLWASSGRPLGALVMARLTVVRGAAGTRGGVRVMAREEGFRRAAR